MGVCQPWALTQLSFHFIARSQPLTEDVPKVPSPWPALMDGAFLTHTHMPAGTIPPAFPHRPVSPPHPATAGQFLNLYHFAFLRNSHPLKKKTNSKT